MNIEINFTNNFQNDITCIKVYEKWKKALNLSIDEIWTEFDFLPNYKFKNLKNLEKNTKDKSEIISIILEMDKW